MNEDEFKKQLTEEQREDFEALLDDAYQEGNEDGYNEGLYDGASDDDYGNAEGVLKERLAYLSLGGEWQRETTGDLYLRGFMDAMETLGFKP